MPEDAPDDPPAPLPTGDGGDDGDGGGGGPKPPPSKRVILGSVRGTLLKEQARKARAGAASSSGVAPSRRALLPTLEQTIVMRKELERISYAPARALLHRLIEGFVEVAPPLTTLSLRPWGKLWDAHRCAYQETRELLASCRSFVSERAARGVWKDLETVVRACGKLDACSVADIVSHPPDKTLF